MNNIFNKVASFSLRLLSQQSLRSHLNINKFLAPIQNRTFSALTNTKIRNEAVTTLLKPESVCCSSHREYKAKLRLRKRCRSCQFVWRNGRLYVECKAYPSHKQHHVSSMIKGYDNIAHGYDPKQPKNPYDIIP